MTIGPIVLRVVATAYGVITFLPSTVLLDSGMSSSGPERAFSLMFVGGSAALAFGGISGNMTLMQTGLMAHGTVAFAIFALIAGEYVRRNSRA